jgi:hypothetical protein
VPGNVGPSETLGTWIWTRVVLLDDSRYLKSHGELSGLGTAM